MRISETRIMSKRVERLIKQDMANNIYPIRSWIKADIPFSQRGLASENTGF